MAFAHRRAERTSSYVKFSKLAIQGQKNAIREKKRLKTSGKMSKIALISHNKQEE